MNTLKNLSVEALTILGAFTMYLKQPALVEPYRLLDEVDLLTLLNGSGFDKGTTFDGADSVNRMALELGWVRSTSHGWAWDPKWIQELRDKKQLAYFYVLVKAANENVAAQRARHR